MNRCGRKKLARKSDIFERYIYRRTYVLIIWIYERQKYLYLVFIIDTKIVSFREIKFFLFFDKYED